MDYSLNLELEIDKGNWALIASCAIKSGKHKGRSVNKVKFELRARVKELKTLGLSLPEIARMVSEWMA